MPGNVEKIFSTGSVLSAAAIYFYNEINTIFVLFNKIKIWCKNPNVLWTATYTIFSDNEEDFKDRNSNFISNLREKDEIKHINIDYNDDNHFKITVTDYRERNIYINKAYRNLEDYEITFKYSSNMSYKESKNEYEYFLDLVKKYSYSLSKKEKLKEYTDQNLLPVYTLAIEFKEYNPYYSILTKNIDSNEIKNFRINFASNGAEIVIIDNKLTIISKKEEIIKKISNDYIAISSK